MTTDASNSRNSLGRRGMHIGAGALLIGAAPAVALLATSTADAATITVANTNDSGTGSLRAALQAASSGDTIDLTGLTGTTGGAAVYLRGDMTMKFTTVNGTTTQNGIAGLYLHMGTDVIDSSIIVGNGTNAAQGMKTYQSNVTITQSLVGDYSDANITTDGTDVTGVSDAGLGTLADNGGPTKTKALLATSPAIGLVTTLPAAFPGSSFDQRGTGYDRVTGSNADAGAFEFGSTPPTTTTSTTSTTTTTTPASTTTIPNREEEIIVPEFTG